MKRFYMLMMALLMSAAAFAAGNAGMKISAEKGERFYLYANGKLYNERPVSEITLTDMPAGVTQLRLEFADQRIPVLQQRVNLVQGRFDSYKISRYRKFYELIFLGSERPEYREGYDKYRRGYDQPADERYRYERNYNYDKRNNYNYYDRGRSYGYERYDYNRYDRGPAYYDNTRTNTQNFDLLRNTVERQSFDSDKLNTMKMAMHGGGYTSAQVATLASMLSFEANRLEFAKYAYEYVSDPNMYFLVMNSLTYSSSRDELNEYVMGK